MKNYSLVLSLFLAFLLISPGTAHSQDTGEAGLSLGSINFPNSATGEAEQEFLTGVLALHSFWYPEARTHFRNARDLDPDFALAYWGEAMTHDHPIWGQHDQQEGEEVLKALDTQLSKGTVNWTKREKAYVEAVRILYNDKMEMGKRRKLYAEAMQGLKEEYPKDDEALAFASLASMTVPSYNYTNPDVRDVVPIAADLESLYKRHPEHPGAMHYLIHLYDSEKFAELGLRPARDYASVAYSSSHAIHMPSHIYRHLEMWEKVIDSNIRAYEASVEWQRQSDRPLRDRDYHSYRWLFEAYLAVENFEKACDKIRELRKLEGEAKDRGEDTGRISSTLQNIEKQFENSPAKMSCGI